MQLHVTITLRFTYRRLGGTLSAKSARSFGLFEHSYHIAPEVMQDALIVLVRHLNVPSDANT